MPAGNMFVATVVVWPNDGAFDVADPVVKASPKEGAVHKLVEKLWRRGCLARLCRRAQKLDRVSARQSKPWPSAQCMQRETPTARVHVRRLPR